MLNISFRRHSLLYGESCFLMIIYFFTPFLFCPDPFATKTKHWLILTRSRRRTLRLLIRLWDSFLVRFIILGLLLCTQIPYGLVLVAAGSFVQKDMLDILANISQDELSYKTLYYAPILHRIGMFLMILMALRTRTDYREWTALDHFEVFSVGRRAQMRIILASGLLIIPELICSWLDMMLLFSLLSSDKHKYMQFTRQPGLQSGLFFVLASLTNTTCCVIRLKPLVSVLYAAICLQKHLRLIRSQLFLSFTRSNSSMESLLKSRLGGQLNTHSRHNMAPLDSSRRDLRQLPVRVGRRRSESGWEVEYGEQIEQIRSGLSGRNDQISLFVGSKRDGFGGERRPSVAIETGDLIAGAEEPLNWKEAPLYEINNLFELEKHLTQIYLFAASIDRSSPGGLFVFTFFNMIGFFYVYLFHRALPSEIADLRFATLYMGARLAPICFLFIAGHLVELESRKISNLIEIIYLESSSHSLLYRQLKDSQFSLARIFRLLSWIKFDGDGILEINFTSLKRLLFYLSSAIFIVIQYDSLLVIEESPSKLVS